MDFKNYILGAERTYEYRLKTVVELDDLLLSKLERVLLKYDPLNYTTPKKTILQTNPLDFATVKNAEIYIIDMELGLPVSPFALQREVCDALNIPSKFLLVRNGNDPTELETNRLNAGREMDEEALKNGLTPGSMLADPTYKDGGNDATKNLYGTEFNSKFLDYVGKVQDSRQQKVDSPNPLFKWLDLPKTEHTDPNAFNANIKDAPQVGGKSGKNKTDTNVNALGNFDDQSKVYRKIFKTKAGKQKIVSKNSDTIKTK